MITPEKTQQKLVISCFKSFVDHQKSIYLMALIREYFEPKTFVIAIYHGKAKLQSVNDYLREFVDEAIYLQRVFF